MKILVTGANGQLGNEMRLVAKGSSDEYIFTDVTEQKGAKTIFLDITDIDALRAIVKSEGVKCIVNCAAYTISCSIILLKFMKSLSIKLKGMQIMN